MPTPVHPTRPLADLTPIDIDGPYSRQRHALWPWLALAIAMPVLAFLIGLLVPDAWILALVHVLP